MSSFSETYWFREPNMIPLVCPNVLVNIETMLGTVFGHWMIAFS